MKTGQVSVDLGETLNGCNWKGVSKKDLAFAGHRDGNFFNHASPPQARAELPGSHGDVRMRLGALGH